MHGFDGQAFDYLLTTGHVKLLLKDFQNFRDTGATVVRSGLRTRIVNPEPSVFDFKNAIEQAIVAKLCGLNILWDLSHYDIPRFISDPFGEELTHVFRKLALEFIKTLKSVGIEEFGICVFNEIEFWSLCVDVNDGYMRPYPITPEQVGQWRLRCIRSMLTVFKDVHSVYPDIPFLVAEPANSQLLKNFLKDAFEIDYETASKLIIGINAYPHSDKPDSMRNSVQYFSKVIDYIKHNYPDNLVIISETGYYGRHRVPWIKKVSEIIKITNLHLAIWYPSLNYESWVNKDVIIPHGGWTQQDERIPYKPLIREVKRLNEKVEELN